MDGTIHKLSAVNAAYFHADDLLEQIRHATGLPRLDWPAGSAKRPAHELKRAMRPVRVARERSGMARAGALAALRSIIRPNDAVLNGTGSGAIEKHD